MHCETSRAGSYVFLVTWARSYVEIKQRIFHDSTQINYMKSKAPILQTQSTTNNKYISIQKVKNIPTPISRNISSCIAVVTATASCSLVVPEKWQHHTLQIDFHNIKYNVKQACAFIWYLTTANRNKDASQNYSFPCFVFSQLFTIRVFGLPSHY